jgi:hypothetical protein
MLIAILIYVWASLTVGMLAVFSDSGWPTAIVSALLWPLGIPIIIGLILFEWVNMWLEKRR